VKLALAYFLYKKITRHCHENITGNQICYRYMKNDQQPRWLRNSSQHEET